MRKIISSVFVLSILTFSIAACTIDDDNPVTCEELYEDILSLKTAIEDLASTSICSGEFECRFIAFGTKPCGGPWKYLIYTTSIDTAELETLVAGLNEQESYYNQTCGAISDCSAAIQPISFTCQDNQCIPMY